jgi:hypothetical protein
MLDYLIIEWGFVGHERQLSFRDWANRWFVALPTVANSEWSSWSLE